MDSRNHRTLHALGSHYSRHTRGGVSLWLCDPRLRASGASCCVVGASAAGEGGSPGGLPDGRRLRGASTGSIRRKLGAPGRGGVLVCAGSLGPGGRVLACVGSESSRELALTRTGTARLCPGASVCAVCLCVIPPGSRVHTDACPPGLAAPRPQGESHLHVHLQVLLWVSCETGHLAGELVSGPTAGASPVDAASRTQKPPGCLYPGDR